MACGTEIVPGYKAFDQVISKNVTNPGLEAKMNQLLANRLRDLPVEVRAAFC